MARRLTELEIAEIAEAYRNGKTVDECIAQFERAEATVYRALRLAGVEMRPHGTRPFGVSASEAEDIANRYASGESIESLRGSFGVKARRFLREQGIETWKKRRKGKYLNSSGYIVLVAPTGERKLEHRAVMEARLGRPLMAHETVHHKNGDRTDNRDENLELRVGRHGKGATEAHCRTCQCFTATDATGFP